MADNPKLPLVVRSFQGHLDLQIKSEPNRSLTADQVTTFNWLLSEAKLRFPHQAVQSLPPLSQEEGPTVTDLSERLRTLADAMGL